MSPPYAPVLEISQETRDIPQENLFLKHHYVFTTHNDHLTNISPFLQFPTKVCENTQVVFHPENGEPRFLIGCNRFKNERRVKRLVHVVNYEDLQSYMYEQGPICLPLMSTVHASLTLIQPQYKLEIKRHHLEEEYDHVARVIIETETGFVTRMTNQRESERLTQDHLSLKKRILAKLIRSLVIKVNTQKENFINDISIRRFCIKKKFPFSLYKDFIDLITYMLRRYPTTSHYFFCGLLFSEAL